MSTSEQKPYADERQKLLAEARADLLKRQLSNAENYDKAILSLSTVFLGFSFAFLKDFVSIDQAEWLCFLHGSWIALTAAVLTTILSFWVGQYAINVQLKRAEDYYLNNKPEALSKSLAARWTDWLNWAAGGFFILGITFTTVFVIVNFERSGKMSQKQTGDGAPIPNLQVAPVEKKSAPIPNLQPVPERPPQGQPSGKNTGPVPSSEKPGK